MDRLHQMNVFVAVVDHGGFARAARALGVSPPAVTRAIAELEARLSARLLTRTTRVVRVTDAGARYVEDCRRILADADEADESAAGAHATPRGRIVVTAPTLFGRIHVTPIVTEYLTRFPETSVTCWFVDRVVNLVEEGADVAVRIGSLPDSTVQAIPVGSVRRVLCASPAYLKRHGTPRQPADLARHSLISASGVTPSREWRFTVDGRAHTVRLAPRLATTTNDTAIVAALDGFGIARLLSYQVTDHLKRGELKVVLASYDREPIPVHVVHREGRHASRKVRAFLDLAIERLRKLPAIDRAKAV
jgi:DNA-binding transcriptional LysR family regulator